MSFAYYAIISVFLCWKWGDWKSWKGYYPTVLFLIMGNLAYMILFKSKPLWANGAFLAKYPALDISTIVVLYFCTVILYLTFYPRFNSNLKRAAYILLWVFIYSAMEYLSYITGHFMYYNGWGILHSVVFNIIMFPLLLLHYKKPILAWVTASAFAYLMMFLFQIPFEV